jgi:hypothetical protein
MRRDGSSILPRVTIEVADGVRRFFVLDPNDVVLNVMSHRPGPEADN